MISATGTGVEHGGAGKNGRDKSNELAVPWSGDMAQLAVIIPAVP